MRGAGECADPLNKWTCGAEQKTFSCVGIQIILFPSVWSYNNVLKPQPNALQLIQTSLRQDCLFRQPSFLPFTQPLHRAVPTSFRAGEPGPITG